MMIVWWWCLLVCIVYCVYSLDCLFLCSLFWKPSLICKWCVYLYIKLIFLRSQIVLSWGTVIKNYAFIAYPCLVPGCLFMRIMFTYMKGECCWCEPQDISTVDCLLHSSSRLIQWAAETFERAVFVTYEQSATHWCVRTLHAKRVKYFHFLFREYLWEFSPQLSHLEIYIYGASCYWEEFTAYIS